MGYTSVDQIIADMSKVYEKLNADPEVKQIIEGIGQARLHIYYTDLDEWVTQAIENGEVRLLKGRVGEAPVSQKIGTDSLVKIMTGEVDPPSLAMAGKISFEGDFTQVLVLQPLLEPTMRAYRALHQDKGSPAGG